MVDLSYSIAFSAGVVSFFAPCLLPLLPAYISYITGVSLKELEKKGYDPFKKEVIISSLFYILGFSLIFVILGITAASLGIVLRQHSRLIQQIGGFLITIFGLEFAGLLKIPFLAKERKVSLPGWTKKLGHFRAFLLGVIFAMAWTPCIGAVLGSILALAAVSGSVVSGASYLLVYSLGISIPFLIVSLTLTAAPKYLKTIGKHIGLITKISGIILVIIGVLLLTDTYKYFNAWIYEIFYGLGYKIN